ncbi:MAG: potassium channel family protein [Synechococcaceae cyanobacterium]
MIPAGSERRHRGYLQLLAVCLLQMALFTLPNPWNRLAAIGYLALGLLMVRVLGHPEANPAGDSLPGRLYRGVGLCALGVSVLWYLTPLELRRTGLPVIALWGVFSLWSSIRLVRCLALERIVNGAVLRGALAGYLMLGLAGGLLCAALETLAPGSFEGVVLSPTAFPQAIPVWHLNFIRLHYYAFITLTTTGFGDVTADTAQSEMLSVAIAVSGTFYLAAVLGLLISRYSVQQQNAE